MLEARLDQASTLKRLLDAIKELVQDANFECTEEGISLQAMDNSHVALCSAKLDATGFTRYRCDRPLPLGVNLGSLTKVLKCAKDDDTCTLKASDDGDILSLTYEARNDERMAEYDMKLMDIDSDTLGIPDTEYDASVTMYSAEFSRIVRDLSQLGESVRIEVSKEGVRFMADGESANGSILMKHTDEARTKWENLGKEDEDGEGANAKDDDDEEEEEEDQGSDEEGSKKRKSKVKKEKAEKKKVKKERDDDGDEEMANADEENEDGEFKAKSDDEGEDEVSDSEKPKKKKKAPAANGKPKKKSKKSEAEDGAVKGVFIEMSQHVTLTFSLKYLVNFSKSAALAPQVRLMLKSDVPLLVEYLFGQGHVRYYLAPKIGDD